MLHMTARAAYIEAAVLGVGADYLLVTATRAGLVEPDWPLRFEAQAGVVDAPIAATLAAARERQAAGEARQVIEEQLTRQASLDLAGTHARLVAALDHALSSAPRTDLSDEERAILATARGKAHHLRAEIAGARSPAALLVLETDLGREVVTPIRTAAAARDARRREATDERERARERADDATRQTKEQAKAKHDRDTVRTASSSSSTDGPPPAPERASSRRS